MHESRKLDLFASMYVRILTFTNSSSRPTSPLISRRMPQSSTHYTDGSISSGDESDNDDIIQSESSYTSDGSDTELPDSGKSAASFLLIRY